MIWRLCNSQLTFDLLLFLQVGGLVLFDLLLHLHQHRTQTVFVFGQPIDDEVVVVDVLAVLLAFVPLVFF